MARVRLQLGRPAGVCWLRAILGEKSVTGAPQAVLNHGLWRPLENRQRRNSLQDYFFERLLRASSFAVRNFVRVSSLIWIWTSRQVRL